MPLSQRPAPIDMSRPVGKSGIFLSKDILTVAYKSLVESILTLNVSTWFNLTSVKSKSKLSRVINQVRKIIGENRTQYLYSTHKQ
jgi:indole-3-glycerol phosphate synthase